MQNDDLYDEYVRRTSLGTDPAKANASADRWGNRVLLSNSPFLIGSGVGTATPTQGQPPARTSATIVTTREFPIPRQISIGVRFALNGPNNAPILPFTSIVPFQAIVQQSVNFRVRQSVDPLAANFTEEFRVGPFPQEFPLDIVTARKLAIDVSMPDKGPEPDSSSIWVEVLAGVVDQLAARNTIPGWGTNVNLSPGFPPFVAASFGIPVPLLPANPGRTQFIVVNTSTNADLLISFGGTASWGPPIVGSVVLPRNNFFSYESPVGGFTGGVTGVWNVAAPNGGAIVTQGAA